MFGVAVEIEVDVDVGVGMDVGVDVGMDVDVVFLPVLGNDDANNTMFCGL